MHFGPQHEAEGLPTHLKRTILLVFSITLHNVPEGLAVGVAFGAAGIAAVGLSAVAAAPNATPTAKPSGTLCNVIEKTSKIVPVGVAFGAAATADNPTAAILAAVSVALGIGIQNFPEGAAVSIPLRQEGLSRKKAFVYGQASGIVEPIGIRKQQLHFRY